MPASSSVERSGFRSAFPGFDCASPATAVPWKYTVFTEYVLSADVGPGCTPDEPMEARRRSWLSTPRFGKKPSSDAIQESDAFG